MKVLTLAALMFLSVGLCPGQKASQNSVTANAAPGVAVIENSCSENRVRREPESSNRDPLQDLENQDRSERIRNEAIRQNEIRVAAGKDTAPLPSRNPITNPFPSPSSSHPYSYTYRVKINNTGEKKIVLLVWEYVIVDPKGIEIGRHRFSTAVSLRPGKTKTLKGYSSTPPGSIVDASKAGEPSESQRSERIVIEAIYYDDDSVWQRSSE